MNFDRVHYVEYAGWSVTGATIQYDKNLKYDYFARIFVSGNIGFKNLSSGAELD